MKSELLDVLIVAGGKGSRLSPNQPKPLVALWSGGPTLLEQTAAIWAHCANMADLNAVASPATLSHARKVLSRTKVRVQPYPRGPIDAIICAADLLSDRPLLVTWVDQPLISVATAQRFCMESMSRVTVERDSISVMGSSHGNGYVYWFREGSNFHIKEVGETEQLLTGFSDCGAFFFSRGNMILEHWEGFLVNENFNGIENEISFLRFVVSLVNGGADIHLMNCVPIGEVPFVNTPEQLRFAAGVLQAR